ncbi:MAG: beta-N-acetylhexosaminidase [Gemmatimonadales bacterium]
MIRATLLLACAAAGTAAAQDSALVRARGNLMPVPRSVSWAAGRMAVDTTFVVAVVAGSPSDGRLERAIARALGRLEARTAVPLSHAVRPGSARLVISVGSPGQAMPALGEDESYSLRIGADSASLRAATTVGAMRGLETLLQLLDSDAHGYFLPAVTIEDAPRFPWRGLLVDAGRHFMPPDVIRRTLDGMAAVKLNVLHWHLSEDQGFRVESRRYPRLQQLGSDGDYYTQQEVREIVAYAGDRGIRVVPEFDMPGHSAAWFVGYPQYAAGPGPYAVVREFGVFDPVFDPTREEVYRFIDGFVAEMAPLFPDAYWHVGGDEVNGRQWAANPAIQAFMRRRGIANAEALQTYFNQRLLQILVRHGKRMVGWDEILGPDLPTTAVIQSWRGTEYLGRAAKQGYSGILSAPFYLDHQSSAEEHYRADPLPVVTDLTAEQQSRVLGGEACMWAEHVGPETVDSRIWPRLAAVAERLWSPREVNDVDDMYRRLKVTSVRLEELGLMHELHTERMLRRIAGDDADVLSGLLEFVQPVTFDQRASIQHTTQLTPLDMVVDAARPDPPARWGEMRAALRLVAAPLDTNAVRAMADELSAVRDAALAALERGATSPAMAQATPSAAAADSVAELGLESARFLVSGQRAGSDWTQAALASLGRWEGPQGLLRVTAAPAVRRLVQAAGGLRDSTTRR